MYYNRSIKQLQQLTTSAPVNQKQILNLSQLMYWLTLDTEEIFRHFNKHIVNEKFFDKRYVFVDMKAPILYVAHIDTVQKLLPANEIRINESNVFATGLDDRLGCYLAFRLNLLGLKGDILICDHEEINMTTAKHFTTDKAYHWVCEFDREGEDAVTYRKSSSLFENSLKSVGISMGVGTYSDISELVLSNRPCMFNLGIGYHRAHSSQSYLDIKEMVRNVGRFSKFYEKFKATSFRVG